MEFGNYFKKFWGTAELRERRDQLNIGRNREADAEALGYALSDLRNNARRGQMFSRDDALTIAAFTTVYRRDYPNLRRAAIAKRPELGRLFDPKQRQRAYHNKHARSNFRQIAKQLGLAPALIPKDDKTDPVGTAVGRAVEVIAAGVHPMSEFEALIARNVGVPATAVPQITKHFSKSAAKTTPPRSVQLRMGNKRPPLFVIRRQVYVSKAAYDDMQKRAWGDETDTHTAKFDYEFSIKNVTTAAASLWLAYDILLPRLRTINTPKEFLQALVSVIAAAHLSGFVDIMFDVDEITEEITAYFLTLGAAIHSKRNGVVGLFEKAVTEASNMTTSVTGRVTKPNPLPVAETSAAGASPPVTMSVAAYRAFADAIVEESVKVEDSASDSSAEEKADDPSDTHTGLIEFFTSIRDSEFMQWFKRLVAVIAAALAASTLLRRIPGINVVETATSLFTDVFYISDIGDAMARVYSIFAEQVIPAVLARDIRLLKPGTLVAKTAVMSQVIQLQGRGVSIEEMIDILVKWHGVYDATTKDSHELKCDLLACIDAMLEYLVKAPADKKITSIGAYQAGLTMVRATVFSDLKNSTRYMPFCVGFTGPPGVGKSRYCHGRMLAILARPLGLPCVKDPRNPDIIRPEASVVIDTVSKFLENVTNSTATVGFDDFNQIVTQPGNNSAVQYFFDVQGSVPVQVPRAMIEAKAGVYYSNKLTWITSNTRDYALTGFIKETGAFLRRITINIHLALDRANGGYMLFITNLDPHTGLPMDPVTVENLPTMDAVYDVMDAQILKAANDYIARKIMHLGATNLSLQLCSRCKNPIGRCSCPIDRALTVIPTIPTLAPACFITPLISHIDSLPSAYAIITVSCLLEDSFALYALQFFDATIVLVFRLTMDAILPDMGVSIPTLVVHWVLTMLLSAGGTIAGVGMFVHVVYDWLIFSTVLQRVLECSRAVIMYRWNDYVGYRHTMIESAITNVVKPESTVAKALIHDLSEHWKERLIHKLPEYGQLVFALRILGVITVGTCMMKLAAAKPRTEEDLWELMAEQDAKSGAEPMTSARAEGFCYGHKFDDVFKKHNFAVATRAMMTGAITFDEAKKLCTDPRLVDRTRDSIPIVVHDMHTAIGEVPLAGDVALTSKLDTIVGGATPVTINGLTNAYATSLSTVYKRSNGTIPKLTTTNLVRVIVQGLVLGKYTNAKCVGYYSGDKIYTVRHAFVEYEEIHSITYFFVNNETRAWNVEKDSVVVGVSYDICWFPAVHARSSIPVLCDYTPVAGARYMLGSTPCEIVSVTQTPCRITRESGGKIIEPAGYFELNTVCSVGQSGTPLFLVHDGTNSVSPVMVGMLTRMTKAGMAVAAPLTWNQVDSVSSGVVVHDRHTSLTVEDVRSWFERYGKPLRDKPHPKSVCHHLTDSELTGLGQYCGSLSKPPAAYTSSFRKTALYDKAVAFSGEVAKYDIPILRPRITGDSWGAPQLAALRQMATSGHEVNQQPFIDAADYIVEEILKVIGEDLKHIKPLTVKEVIKGTEYSNPLNLDAGFGFPHEDKLKSDCIVGSHDDPRFVGWFAQELLDELDLVDKNIPPPNVSYAVPKDAVEKKSKIESANERIFFAGNFHYLVLCRFYLTPLLDLFVKHRDKLPCQIGMNASGKEFHTKLSSMARQVRADVLDQILRWLDTDFRFFDKSLFTTNYVPYIIGKLLEKSGYSAESIRRAKVISLSQSRYVVIIDNDVWLIEFKLASGLWGTTLFGSMCEWQIEVIEFCYVHVLHTTGGNPTDGLFVRATLSRFDFTANVALVCYGDDNLKCLSDDVLSWYKPGVIELFSAFIKMGITTTRKDDSLISLMPVTSVSFLKRTPTFDEHSGTFMGQLALVSIIKSLAFTDSVQPDWEVMVLRQAYRELSFYPSAVYDRFQAMFGEGPDQMTLRQECLQSSKWVWFPSEATMSTKVEELYLTPLMFEEISTVEPGLTNKSVV